MRCEWVTGCRADAANHVRRTTALIGLVIKEDLCDEHTGEVKRLYAGAGLPAPEVTPLAPATVAERTNEQRT